MDQSYFIYEKQPERLIARFRFNRPEKLNAITTAQEDELRAKVVEAESDEQVKVIIFQGEGRCFGSGYDVGRLGPHIGIGGPEDRRPSQRERLLHNKNAFWGTPGLYQTIMRCAKPTIAQVHGYCYGAHLHMAIGCDFVVAAENAVFGHPGYRYMGPMGPIALFMLLMGVRKTKEMMLQGKNLNAQEAVESGLINKVVPLENLADEVNKLADDIARQPFDALVMGKCFFELAYDIMGVGNSATASYIAHGFQTNIRYEPGEYNLLKAKRQGGVSGAIKEREKHYKGSEMANPDVK